MTLKLSGYESRKGRKMATIRDIALACNVSIATVSNILNDKGKASRETEQLVLKKAKELKYKPNLVARNLRMKNTRTVGILLEDITIFHVPEIVEGITEYCEDAGYNIVFSNLRLYSKYGDTYYENTDFYGSVQEEIAELMAKQIEGLIYITAHERVLKCIPEDLNIPAVMVYGYTMSKSIPSIVVGDRDGASEAAAEAVRNGHRKIGIITGKENSIHCRLRMEGYLRTLHHEGLADGNLPVFYGQWSREAGYEGAGRLLQTDVTAILCMSDEIAGGVYDYCHEHSLVPGEDISVIGYDDRKFSDYLYPALTTVKMPLYAMGIKACEILMEMKKGTKEPKTIRIHEEKPSLITRESVQRL